MKPFNHLTIQPLRSLLSSQSRAWPILAVLAVIALIIAYLALQPFTPGVRSTIPASGQAEVDLEQPISVFFTRDLNTRQQNQLLITAEPRLDGQITFTEPANQVYYTATNPLQPDTKYTISVTGNSIRPHTFTFTTRSATSLDNIKATQQLPKTENRQPTTNTEAPKTNLINSLPYRTDNFHLQYAVVSDTFYISVWQEPVDQHQQAAIDHIKTFGIENPRQDLNIQYLIPKDIDPNTEIEDPRVFEQTTTP